MVLKKLSPKHFFVKENLRLKRIEGPKKFKVQKMFGLKHFVFKNVGCKNLAQNNKVKNGPKKFGAKQIFGPKNRVKKVWSKSGQ